MGCSLVFHALHGILLFFHEITYMIFSLSEKVDIFLRGIKCVLVVPGVIILDFLSD